MARSNASVPLSGPARHLGRELLRGAELALERAGHGAPELVVIDTGGDSREERAADAARLAADDGDAVAYLGDFYDERVADDVGAAQAVLYVGVAGTGAVDLWQELHAANPDMWLLGVEGVAVPWLAAAVSESAAERTRFFQAYGCLAIIDGELVSA
jgi:hypothetical protein